MSSIVPVFKGEKKYRYRCSPDEGRFARKRKAARAMRYFDISHMKERLEYLKI